MLLNMNWIYLHRFWLDCSMNVRGIYISRTMDMFGNVVNQRCFYKIHPRAHEQNDINGRQGNCCYAHNYVKLNNALYRLLKSSIVTHWMFKHRCKSSILRHVFNSFMFSRLFKTLFKFGTHSLFPFILRIYFTPGLRFITSFSAILLDGSFEVFPALGTSNQ